MRFIRPLLLLTAAFLLVGVLAIQLSPPTSASVQFYGRGKAVWISSTCSSPQPNTAARWTVKPDPEIPGQEKLIFRVENAYPGFNLECDLDFANTGNFPFRVTRIKVINANPLDLTVLAVIKPAGQGRMILPCGSPPYWGIPLNTIPAACREQVRVSLTSGENIAESTAFLFAVQIKLEEKR